MTVPVAIVILMIAIFRDYGFPIFRDYGFSILRLPPSLLPFGLATELSAQLLATIIISCIIIIIIISIIIIIIINHTQSYTIMGS